MLLRDSSRRPEKHPQLESAIALLKQTASVLICWNPHFNL